MNKVEITIGIPVYNDDRHIRQSIESVLNLIGKRLANKGTKELDQLFILQPLCSPSYSRKNFVL